MPTDVSICIVSYNCRELLRQCLRALEADGTRLQRDLLVVDNASADGTAAMVKTEFPAVRFIASADNRGFAAGCNEAMRHARGRVRVLLNPDTEVTAGAMDRLVRFLDTHPEVGAVGGKLVGGDGRRQSTCHPFPTLLTTLAAQFALPRALPQTRAFGHYDLSWWDHESPRRVDWVSGACLATTAAVWQEVGGLDEGYFMYSEEVDWCYRLARTGYQCWYVPEAVVVHHEAGTWASLRQERILASHRSNFRFFGKNHGVAAELTVRALVGVGALFRAALWSVAPKSFRATGAVVTAPATHLAVAKLALQLGDCQAVNR